MGSMCEVIEKSGKMKFQTFKEVKEIVYYLNKHVNNLSKVGAVAELMINAIEHGNLNIGYDEKSKLIEDEIYDEEIERRLELDEYKEKYAHIHYKFEEDILNVVIEDQGNGFDYEVYKKIDQKRLFDSHGRGIHIANMITNNNIKYLNAGNKVRVKIKI